MPESVENELANRYKELFEIFINNKEKITWLVNDVSYKTFTPNDTQGQPYLFNDEFYLLMNLSVGGNWPISPKRLVYPTFLIVDYVSVFQEK